MNRTDLIIVGGGAAGLMAGCAAGELGLKALVLERKHKPGRKLLMCGNGRCNLTTNISAERMQQMFGEPIGSFLEPALQAFTPSMLQRWFAAKGLKTVVKAGNKVYPQTECAGDVVNLFMDGLREGGVSLACSSAVNAIEKIKGGFRVATDNFVVEGAHLLIATGGVSYPKTGSLGDGQHWAARMGHRVEEAKPGLIGFEVDSKVLRGRVGKAFEKVILEVVAEGETVAETRGVYEIEKWGIAGTAVTNASRVVTRLGLKDYLFRIQLAEGRVEEVKPFRPRPLKEAMVTVGGVNLREVDRRTMESKKVHNLYFAGEVLDVDGPTGGYNLTAAFASARLAVETVARQCGKRGYAPLEERKPKPAPRRRGRRS